MDLKRLLKVAGPGVLIAAVCVAAVLRTRLGRERSLSGAGLQDRMKGSPQAPLLLVEYSDFQCPNCKQAAPLIQGLLASYDGKARLMFRHFPLEGHRWARGAAHAAECAAYQGKFWPYHDLLFVKQEEWSAAADAIPLFAKYADDMGLDLDRFSACFNDPKTAEAVKSDENEGAAWQVNATPTLLVGRRRLVGARQIYYGGAKTIERELKP